MDGCELMYVGTVKTSVQAELDKLWEFWTKPKHITNWNFATN